MPNPPPGIRRCFLPWEGPWLPRAAAWLAGDWAGPGPLDLADVLAIVPTRQAGRRLREALAALAAARGGAVFPPCTHTPDTLIAAGAAAPDVASRWETRLAWHAVLRTIPEGRWPELFPAPPARIEVAWIDRLAEDLGRLQTHLAEGGLSCAEVAGRVDGDWAEARRWRELADLEAEHAARLARLGRREPHAARLAWARRPPPPPGVGRVVVLGVPDPLPLAAAVLESWARTLPVEVVVCAPEEERAGFDDLGRPRVEAWSARAPAWADFERQVRLCADPAETALVVARRVRGVAGPDGRVAIGVADPELGPLLAGELARAGVASFDPEGRRRRCEGLFVLLAALAALVREDGAEAVAALARCPDFLVAVRRRAGPGFSAARLLAGIDELRARHLAPDLAALRRFARSGADEVAGALDLIADLRERLTRGTFPANALEALGVLFEGRRFERRVPGEARTAAALGAWRDLLGAGAAAAPVFPDLETGDWWELALRQFGEERVTGEKPPGALELQGWLELAWEDAPHLIVAGLNEGCVPEAVAGDAYLPESLRERLGLKTNAARLARDAYLLQVLAAGRGPGGRLDVFLAKTAASGDPRRPSRLLLQCPAAALPRRVEFLFRRADAARPNPAWRRAWRLQVPRRAPPAQVSVTGLRDWLACPFRFYLRQVLRMEAVDPFKSELDARDFGTLCHAALEALAREPALRAGTDETLLREFLLEELARRARERYGARPVVPLVVQLESARQRLARAAAVLARDHAEGWGIEHVEWPLTLDLGGLVVRGRIDRIDRHAATGAWRVLDYKTSDTAVTPLRAHLRPRRAGDEALPAWRRTEVGGRDLVWTDLQLPLYLRALRGQPAAPASLVAGYFNLPKAAGGAAVAPWPELTGELRAAADACADGVAAAIRAGEFWPPAELPADRDDYAALFHEGAAASVVWEEER